MFSSDAPLRFGDVIEWNGGDCPVHPDTIVKFWYRSGRNGIGRAIPDTMRVEPAIRYAHLIWQHAPAKGRSKPENDIIAYQVSNG